MIKKAFKSTSLPVVLFVMAVLSAIFFRASRSNWVFINVTLNFEYFTVTVLCLMALAAIILGVLSYAKIKKCVFCEMGYALMIAGLVSGPAFYAEGTVGDCRAAALDGVCQSAICLSADHWSAILNLLWQ